MAPLEGFVETTTPYGTPIYVPQSHVTTATTTPQGTPLNIAGLLNAASGIVGTILGGGVSNSPPPPQQPQFQAQTGNPGANLQPQTPQSGEVPRSPTQNTNISNENNIDNRQIDFSGLMPQGGMNYPSPAGPVNVPQGNPAQFIPAVYNGSPGGDGGAMNAGYQQQRGLVPPPPPYAPAIGGGGGNIEDLGNFMNAFASVLNGPGQQLGGGAGFGQPGMMPPPGMGGQMMQVPPGMGGYPQPAAPYMGVGVAPPQFGGQPVMMPQGGGNPFEGVEGPNYQNYTLSNETKRALEGDIAPDGTEKFHGMRQELDEQRQWLKDHDPQAELQRQADQLYPNTNAKPTKMQRLMGFVTASTPNQLNEAMNPRTSAEKRREYIAQQQASHQFQESVRTFQMAKEEYGRMLRGYGQLEASVGRLNKAEEEMRYRMGKLTSSEKTGLANTALTMPPGPEKDAWLKLWVEAGGFSPREALALRGQVVAKATEQDLSIAGKYNSYLLGMFNIRSQQITTQLAQDTYAAKVMSAGLDAYSKYLDTQKKQFDVNHQGAEFAANIQAKQAQAAAARSLINDRQLDNERSWQFLKQKTLGMMTMVGDFNHSNVDPGVMNEMAQSYQLITRSALDSNPKATSFWNAVKSRYPTMQDLQQNSGTIEATIQAANLPYSFEDFMIGYEGASPFFKAPWSMKPKPGQ